MRLSDGSAMPTTRSCGLLDPGAFVVTYVVKLPTTGLRGNSGSRQPQTTNAFQSPLLHKPPRQPRISCSKTYYGLRPLLALFAGCALVLNATSVVGH